ncbi:uncharacterized protein LOC130787384 [Actinidia eriantha]|uniref:uncharacterized protein LOC130787384 n=1 Tax=Actinidia eriantha TaxID=165200 RepID=UPI002590157F|nr:uncharacterized protein LOC130787384 [Actinidia eriantha]
MASHFAVWEKDPFFSAAEEVQESADRMESTYRTWIHSLKDSSSMWNSEELRRDLLTALIITKWQLEEFERIVKSSYTNSNSDVAKERHCEFVSAIGSQIQIIEKSLHQSSVSNGKPPLPWVRLDEGECNELALFLSGPSMCVERTFAQPVNSQKTDKHSTQDCSKNSRHSVEHDVLPQTLSNGHRHPVLPPPPQIPGLGLLSSIETVFKLNWSNNGYKKLKNADHHQEAGTPLPQSRQLTRAYIPDLSAKGINACYERSKSCLDGCDDYCDKQLHGWYGAIQRLLQRSQYQMQYSRPFQVVFSTVLLLGLIVLFALRAI